jgi:hypothetical protein
MVADLMKFLRQQMDTGVRVAIRFIKDLLKCTEIIQAKIRCVNLLLKGSITKMKTKTKLEIIDETVAYYSEDVSRRAIISSGSMSPCLYLTKDGRMCAVGRCLSEKGLEIYGNLSSCFTYGMIKYMKPGYVIEDSGFWANLQELHDSNDFWDKDGLSPNGALKVIELKEEYGQV